jgi:hypothetical protein
VEYVFGDAQNAHIKSESSSPDVKAGTRRSFDPADYPCVWRGGAGDMG